MRFPFSENEWKVVAGYGKFSILSSSYHGGNSIYLTTDGLTSLANPLKKTEQGSPPLGSYLLAIASLSPFSYTGYIAPKQLETQHTQ